MTELLEILELEDGLHLLGERDLREEVAPAREGAVVGARSLLMAMPSEVNTAYVHALEPSLPYSLPSTSTSHLEKKLQSSFWSGTMCARTRSSDACKGCA